MGPSGRLLDAFLEVWFAVRLLEGPGGVAVLTARGWGVGPSGASKGEDLGGGGQGSHTPVDPTGSFTQNTQLFEIWRVPLKDS